MELSIENHQQLQGMTGKRLYVQGALAKSNRNIWIASSGSDGIPIDKKSLGILLKSNCLSNMSTYL